MTVRLWQAYLAVGAVTLCVFELLPIGPARDIAYLAVGASSVGAIAAGIRLHAPSHPLPWRLMLTGQLLWVLGDALSSWSQDVAHSDAYPSWADAFYLVAYPVLGVGLIALIRGRRLRHDLGGLLDSATLTVSLGLLSWVLLAVPTFNASRSSWSAAAVSVTYPLADILLAGLLIRLVTTPGVRTPSFRGLMVAVLLLIIGDTLYDALALWTTQDLHSLDVIWLASYVVWGVAALHPSMTSLSEPVDTIHVHFTVKRLVTLGTASLVAPAILAADKLLRVQIDVWAIATGSATMFLLVIARMSVAIRHIVAANDERERLQRHLAYQATHDALTELPNRAQAMHEIEAALQRAQRTGALIGLLFIDLDGFKAVNDTFGHRAGDEVLRSVAGRVQALVRAGDMVARLGGDEFVVLLEPLEHESDAMHVATRIVGIVREPISVGDGRQVTVAASVGMAVSQDGSTDAQRLLHEADTAGYRAKNAGRGRVEVFDQSLRRELAERAELETALADAITGDQLLLLYQPITDLRQDTIHGYEALVRWDRPGHGLIAPDVFIPTAELSDLIYDLDTWVLQRATEQMARWTAAGMPSRTIAVNISGRHICSPRIIQDVRTALETSGLDPRQLILEITETVLIEDLLATHHLHQLRAMGVSVSIDDFGTGYNSITRLQHLPIDIIKIDRSFLGQTPDAPNALLKLIVQTAHTFGLPVVAEGIEHAHQLQALSTVSCEFGQGFYLSKPLHPSQIEPNTCDSPTTPLPEPRRPRKGPVPIAGHRRPTAAALKRGGVSL